MTYRREIYRKSTGQNIAGSVLNEFYKSRS